ncbi:MAG TPA: hypothetical protein VJV78_45085 [Polyangiales bacterium]|nr:hypothetical protein [Polyangiales bacterium]
MAAASTAPLTVSRKARLVMICLPFPFWIAAVVFYYAFWVDFASGATGVTAGKSWLFAALMLVVLAVTGLQALRGLRDLVAGVALVTEDRLLRVSRGGRYRRAKFDKLGQVRMLHWSGSPGETLRVVYSPATKIVWDASPLSTGAPGR